MHGVGLCDEYPIVVYPEDADRAVYDAVVAPGMVLCVEAYVGAEGGGEGVKLEEQVLITETGGEVLSRYPFDPALEGERALALALTCRWPRPGGIAKFLYLKAVAGGIAEKRRIDVEFLAQRRRPVKGDAARPPLTINPVNVIDHESVGHARIVRHRPVAADAEKTVAGDAVDMAMVVLVQHQVETDHLAQKG